MAFNNIYFIISWPGKSLANTPLTPTNTYARRVNKKNTPFGLTIKTTLKYHLLLFGLFGLNETKHFACLQAAAAKHFRFVFCQKGKTTERRCSEVVGGEKKWSAQTNRN